MAVPKKLPESTRRLLELTDADIGRSIHDYFLAEVREQVTNDFVVVRLLERLREGFFEATITDPSAALHSIGYFLAIDGQYERAGRALRTFYSEVFPLLRNAGVRKKAIDALDAGNVAKEVRAAQRRERWQALGLEIRKAERGWPMSNKCLYRKIVERIDDDDAHSTLYREIGKLGLGAKEWRDKLRAANAVKREQAPRARNKQTRNKTLAKRR